MKLRSCCVPSLIILFLCSTLTLYHFAYYPSEQKPPHILNPDTVVNVVFGTDRYDFRAALTVIRSILEHASPACLDRLNITIFTNQSYIIPFEEKIACVQTKPPSARPKRNYRSRRRRRHGWYSKKTPEETPNPDKIAYDLFTKSEVPISVAALDIRSKEDQAALEDILEHQKLDRKEIGSMFNYARFYIADIMSTVDKFIWLDADIVVMDSICKLYDSALPVANLSDHPVLAAVDRPSRSLKHADINYTRIPKAYSNFLPQNLSEPSFNAGILLINAYRWRRENVTRTLEELMIMNEVARAWKQATQPPLLLMFATNDLNGGFVKLEHGWNRDGFGYKHHIKLDRNSTSIVHFTGTKKPWLSFGLHSEIWRPYHRGLERCFSRYDKRREILHLRRPIARAHVISTKRSDQPDLFHNSMGLTKVVRPNIDSKMAEEVFVKIKQARANALDMAVR